MSSVTDNPSNIDLLESGNGELRKLNMIYEVFQVLVLGIVFTFIDIVQQNYLRLSIRRIDR